MTPEAASASASPGVLGEVSNILAAARRTVSGAFELAALEAKRAGLALAWMIGLGVAAAILVVTAWMGLMAALAICAVESLDMPWFGAILLVVLLNLGGAAAAMKVCMKMSKDLMFEASRRQLAK